jgi:hypothetical protein
MRGLEREHRRDLLNPWRWVALAFERVVRFPRYVLAQAGFGPSVTESRTVRVVTVAWALVVGASTIGAFVVALLTFSRES